MLQSYSPTSQVVLRATRNYWGAKKPPFRAVVIRNMPAGSPAHQHPAWIPSDRGRPLRRSGADAERRRPPSCIARTVDVDLLHVRAQRPADLIGHLEQALSTGSPVRPRLQGDSRDRGAGCGPGARDHPVDDYRRSAAEERNQAELAKAEAELAASGVRTQHVTLEYPSDLTINGVSFATLAAEGAGQSAEGRIRHRACRVAGGDVPTEVPRRARGLRHLAVAARLPRSRGLHRVHPGPTHRATRRLAGGERPGDREARREALVATEPATRGSLYRQIQLGLNARSPFIPLIQPTQAFVTTTDLANATFSGVYGVDVTQIPRSNHARERGHPRAADQIAPLRSSRPLLSVTAAGRPGSGSQGLHPAHGVGLRGDHVLRTDPRHLHIRRRSIDSPHHASRRGP